MAQLEQDYKQAREKGMSPCRSLTITHTSTEDGEDDWGLSNPNHMTTPEGDCDSESDEPGECD